MNDYIKSQQMAAGPISNDDLLCKSCEFRTEKSGICYVYNGKENGFKPEEVLDGGDCKYFKDEDIP